MIVTAAVANKTVKPRSAVLAMPEYHPPLAEREVLRLDFNENTFAPSPKVIERLREVTAEGLTKYPEREPAERIVARHFELQAEQVLLTNGVDEAIHLMCCAFLEAEDEALIATPSFFMYDVSVQLMTPNLRMESAICRICFLECVRALRCAGLRLCGESISTGHGSSMPAWRAWIWFFLSFFATPLTMD